ncbi:trehalose-6-phosphate synthase [Pseudotabrizicola formosa]|uniref:trehalose-6-phosphate synthase n=1 Tax=Pseudotabrizicola formosa TaxID=2030009 RepID=UPI000CCFF72C|nr:trehalose-6-phosphate synthase [Pseudotabrizicola formosa]
MALFRINFIDCIDRTLESRINHETWSVRYGGKVSRVRTYPISIAWPDRPPQPPHTPFAREALGMKSAAKLILAVGRLDYTKGIPEFMQAFEDLLTRHLELRGNVHLYHVAAPSRSEVASYRSLHHNCLRISQAINDRFGTEDYTPLLFVDRHFDREEQEHLSLGRTDAGRCGAGAQPQSDAPPQRQRSGSSGAWRCARPVRHFFSGDRKTRCKSPPSLTCPKPPCFSTSTVHLLNMRHIQRACVSRRICRIFWES